MLVAARGRERSAAEYAELAGRCGLGLESTWHTPGGKYFMVFRRE